MKVTDASGSSQGFNNGSSGTGNDFAYDGAGNMTQDLNRGIASGALRYNVLNLPRQIVIDGKTLGYHYDGNGQKLRMSNSNGTVNTKYAGGFEYNSGNYLTRIVTEEGQINVTNNGNDFAFEYYLKDHLVDTRMVINEAGMIIQETEYFAFGLAIPKLAGSNKYLYNGKELQPETGYLDYDARQYDPTLGRWFTIDPLSEKTHNLSPFNYANNNPVIFIDPDGRSPVLVGEEAQEAFRQLQDKNKSRNKEISDDNLTKGKYSYESPNVRAAEAKHGFGLEARLGESGWKPGNSPMPPADKVSPDRSIESMAIGGAVLNTPMAWAIGMIRGSWLASKLFGEVVDVTANTGYNMTSTAVRSALADRVDKRGFTEVGYQFQKHFGRGGNWGNAIPQVAKLNPATFNESGYKTF